MTQRIGFFLWALCLLFSVSHSYAQQAITQAGKYQYYVDLTRVSDDKLDVTLITPKISPSGQVDETVYYMPKIVPGTYSIYDFGRFLSDFKAFDATGKPLSVVRLDENRFKIVGASKLYKITYRVEDTYDTSQDNFIFEPCGTNIEANANFVINTHGFFGYFEDMKRTPYEINFTKPQDFFGASSMTSKAVDATTDRFAIDNYMDLVDSPIMYCRPDTTTINVGGADVLISVYSPGKSVNSKKVAENIRTTLDAQKNYLGGKLPIHRYAFIIYMYQNSGSGALGALEHSYSSMYFLPDNSREEDIMQTIRDVAAHEFFHILTPLNIHSEQIHDFDYIQPEMSKHLWLYEGVTEYFAGHVQAKYGLLGLEEYLYVLRNKMIAAEGYKRNLPFTELSKKCLDTYKDEYGNVYEKGALIALCLDLKLQQLSKGEYNLQKLMAELSKTYGKDKPFRDEELFDQITKMTYPEIRRFFADYVEGAKPLPLEELLGTVGINYKALDKREQISLGNITLAPDETNNAIYVADNSQADNLGVQLGYQVDDRIVQINKDKLTLSNYMDVFSKLLNNAKAGDKITIVVERKEKNGKVKKKKLKGKLISHEVEDHHAIEPNPNATPAQLQLRKSWLQ